MARKFKLVVLSNCTEGTDAAFNEWYDNVHLRDVLKVDDFVSAQRFEMSVPMSEGKQYKYCAIYNVETDDPEAALNRLNSKAGTPEMALSDTLVEVHAALYEEHGPLVQA